MNDTGESDGRGDELLRRLDQLEDLITEKIVDSQWDLNDCAAFMKCSESTARRALSQPGAPRPCQPQTDKGGRRMQPRYVPNEVRKWFRDPVNRASSPTLMRRAGSRSVTF